MKKIALFLVLLLPLSGFASNKNAEIHMEELGSQVIQILNDDSVNKEQTQAEFESLLDENFALESMGKFVLGRYWRRATAEEKAEFQKLFRKSILSTYSSRFETNTSAKFQVTGSRTENDDAIMIHSQLIRESGKPIHIDWRLYADENGYRIYDVLLEGVSMSITQRSEYAAVIQREGGKVAGLNQALQSKTAGLMG